MLLFFFEIETKNTTTTTKSESWGFLRNIFHVFLLLLIFVTTITIFFVQLHEVEERKKNLAWNIVVIIILSQLK